MQIRYPLMAGAIVLAGLGYASAQYFPGLIGGGTVLGNTGTSNAVPGPTTAPVLGIPGTSTGQIGFAGATSGTVTVKSVPVAGSYNFNLPATAGTAGQPLISGGGVAAAQTYGTLGVAGGGTNCAVASGTCLDNITGFSSTGFLQRTGAGTYSFGASSTISSLCGATGLKITNNAGTPSTKIDISADQLVMTISGTNVPIFRTSVAFTIDTTTGAVTSAANGMDGEARPTSGWLNIWAIDNGTTTAGLGAISSTTPTLPAGYTYQCRLGAVRFDGSQNALRSIQLGKKSQYIVTGSGNMAHLPLIDSGVLGTYSISANPMTFKTESISAFVPATGTEIILSLATRYNGGLDSAVVVAPNSNYGGYSTTNQAPIILDATASTGAAYYGSMVLESTNIFVATSGAGGGISAFGWVDNVNAN